MTLYFSAFAICMAGVIGATGLPTTGPHKVDHIDQWNFASTPSRTVGIEIWHPHDRESGLFPLLLFSPGFGNKPSQYLSQLEDLASQGYVIAAVDHPVDVLNSFEARAVLWAQDIVSAKQEVLGSSSREIIDSSKIGAFGHSLGGRAAAGSCLLDSSIRACLNEDGSNDDVQLKRPYWPVEKRSFTGVFAMLDWFDPGLDDEDLRVMGRSREQYAASRLEPSPEALNVYRAPIGGSVRITILTPGMRHTAFTDDLWSAATSDTQRMRYANYLRHISTITLNFFHTALNTDNSLCGAAEKDTYTQCFSPTDDIAPR